jgi:type II secretory pathway component PulF
METASLDDFVTLNEQLAALLAAGVPLELGLPQRGAPVAKELELINATVARRVNRGESLTEALEGDEGDVPAAYRSAMQFGLQTGNLSAALEGSSQVAEAVEDSRVTFESAIVYPLIVCVLAYVGLICFTLYLVPTLGEMYTTLDLKPGPGIRALRALRMTIWYWAFFPPLLLVLLAGWWLRFRQRGAVVPRVRWLPGTSRIIFQQRCARFAAALARLLDNHVSLPDALTISGEVCGDKTLARGAKSLAAAEHEGHWPADSSALALEFPPFLRWAIWHADATTGRARALDIAAKMYRESAERRAARLRTLAPIVALVLLGGTVTLLYGMTLFVPVVELLRTLAH